MQCWDREFLCDLAEQSWAVKTVMNSVLGPKEFLCDLAEQSWAVKAEYILNAERGPKLFVCDLAEQSWAVKAELRIQCWDWKSLCVT